MKQLKLFSLGAWLCIGDFNKILAQDKKWGASDRRGRQIDGFREAIEECNLSDLGYVGPKYTWTNYSGGVEFIKERLDRALANQRWGEMH
jgi:hypothetical protein